ncbi:MAG: hypothetical protein CVV23_12160 [Ignavibacteriae bacterium HGW-Ignavibacteriae-2]|jgi:hypothetical protein|nr:MAG: hypothetical protein CVV23_12160 [Ignavibacteriae bacterium HGW-Ignavibacteriae-2]
MKTSTTLRSGVIIIFTLLFICLNSTFKAQTIINWRKQKSAINNLTRTTLSGKLIHFKKDADSFLLVSSNVYSNRNLGAINFRTNNAFSESTAPSKSLFEAKSILLLNDIQKTDQLELRVQTDEDESKKTGDNNRSFFKSDLFYFIGATALATTFYLIWSDDNNQVSKKTFGIPPKP